MLLSVEKQGISDSKDMPLEFGLIVKTILYIIISPLQKPSNVKPCLQFLNLPFYCNELMALTVTQISLQHNNIYLLSVLISKVCKVVEIDCNLLFRVKMIKIRPDKFDHTVRINNILVVAFVKIPKLLSNQSV